jgi:hypothetical protein
MLAYTSDGHGGTITHTAAPEYLDDGPQKPIRIWSRTGRRPLLAGGNSNGDVPMLEFAHREDKPTLRLLVLHDDADRGIRLHGRRRAGTRAGAERRLDDRQHQGRLGNRLLRRQPRSASVAA